MSFPKIENTTTRASTTTLPTKYKHHIPHILHSHRNAIDTGMWGLAAGKKITWNESFRPEYQQHKEDKIRAAYSPRAYGVKQ